MESQTKSRNNSKSSQTTERQKCNESQSTFESRETSYIAFISSLPRLCSPTICGTTNYKTPNRSKWSSLTPLDRSLQSFEWSIEQKALLDPCDFSNTEDMDVFREIDERMISKQLDDENERFFSQKQIIPSPKTPKKCFQSIDETTEEMSEESFDRNWSQMNKTPEYQGISGESGADNCLKTPLNYSKSRQKKKLFGAEGLMETLYSRSPKDSAFDTIDSRSLLSPIYSPDWRNTSLSKRITHLSPIRSQNSNHIDLDFGIDLENSFNEQSMRSQTDSYSNITCDMVSVESQIQHKNGSIYGFPDNSNEQNLNVFPEYNNRCEQKVLQRFLTKTSTPSHL